MMIMDILNGTQETTHKSRMAATVRIRLDAGYLSLVWLRRNSEPFEPLVAARTTE